MKRIFLIGDSIRLGYDSHVRDILIDSAQVYWSGENARFVQYTLRCAHEWAKADCEPEKIDVVHWNNGLWDVLRQMGDEPLVSPDEYEKGLTRIIRRLRLLFPNARLIFGLTTSVIEERMDPNFCRRNADIEAYNAVARAVMAREGIEVNDLYEVATRMSDDWHSTDGTHFTPEGYRMLAQAVAAAVMAPEN